MEHQRPGFCHTEKTPSPTSPFNKVKDRISVNCQHRWDVIEFCDQYLMAGL